MFLCKYLMKIFYVNVNLKGKYKYSVKMLTVYANNKCKYYM